MTQVPTESQDIRRHPDGSIDIDFYRTRAAALRGQAKRDGVTIVLIEQFVHRALALADTCVILSQGHVAWSGPAAEAKEAALDRYLGGGAA